MENKTNPERGNEKAIESTDSEAITRTEKSNQPTKPWSNKFGLTKAEVDAEFEKLNRVKLKPKGGNRDRLIADITDHAQAMIEYFGAQLLGANAVCSYLEEKGLGKKADGSKHLRANGFGDGMGGHGLQLPCRVLGGKKRYDLGSIGADAATKLATQEELNNLEVAEVKALKFA